MPVRTSGDLARFRSRVEALVHHHPVVVDNAYTRWFATGSADRDEVRHLAVQFSVFSHQFVEAQLRKVLNAADLDSYRAGKEILMNELGVVFKPTGAAAAAAARGAGVSPAEHTDPDIVGTEGTVDGGRFRFTAAHFEWLLRFGAPVGLGFDDLGKRRHGTASTLFFCDELLRIYGSEDASIAEGASYAVENWAAAGFWQDLEDGLLKIKKTRIPNLRLAFFTWHNRVEGQHAGHVMEELEEAYFNPRFDRDKFFQGGREVLEAVAAFWDGLESDRVNKVTT